MKLELIMPISAGLREDIAVYGGFIGQQYLKILKTLLFTCKYQRKYYLCFVHSRLTMRRLDYKRITN